MGTEVPLAVLISAGHSFGREVNVAAIGWVWFAFVALSALFAGRLWATIIAELLKSAAGRAGPHRRVPVSRLCRVAIRFLPGDFTPRGNDTASWSARVSRQRADVVAQYPVARPVHGVAGNDPQKDRKTPRGEPPCGAGTSCVSLPRAELFDPRGPAAFEMSGSPTVGHQFLQDGVVRLHDVIPRRRFQQGRRASASVIPEFLTTDDADNTDTR